MAWHERHISDHLHQLTRAADHTDGPLERLQAVLETFAALTHQHHDGDLAALLHRGEHVSRAHQHLHIFVQDLMADAAAAGALRNDVPADELATYCLHALSAASSLETAEAVHRLVQITLAGLVAHLHPGLNPYQRGQGTE